MLFLATEVVSGQIVAEIPIPTPNSRPFFLTVGPDGAIWFSENEQPGGVPGTNKVGRVTSPVGPITEVAVNDGTGNSGGLYGIASGADGNLWIADTAAMRIARLTLGGNTTLFAAPYFLGGAFQLVAGSDGTLWFTRLSEANVGRVTLNGVFSTYALPENPPPNNFIAADTNGAV
jgi:virginiamycin B lyase